MSWAERAPVSGAQVLSFVDPWAPVPFDQLPARLVEAFELKDWSAVGVELHKIMDGVVTDSAYGRQLLSLVLQLPIAIDPIFDRYRAMTSLDFGDRDGLKRCREARHLAKARGTLGAANRTETAMRLVGHREAIDDDGASRPVR